MKKRIVPSALIALSGAVMFGSQVFATNQYGIEYSGGSNLDAQNVTIDPSLIEGLTRIIPPENRTVAYSSSAKWEEGYKKFGSDCSKVKYFRVWDDSITTSSGLSYTIEDSEYAIDVDFDKVILEDVEGMSEGGDSLSVMVEEGVGSVDGGREVYTDSTCTTIVSNIVTLQSTGGGKLFAQVHANLHKKGSTKPVKSDQMYLEIADIDALQSYKILNNDSLLKVGNMFAKSAADLQPTEGTEKNKFVASGNYIYADGPFDTDKSDVYVKLGENTQTNGLDIVLGYAGTAGSEIRYFAKEYTVTYKSDEKGAVTGIDSEMVFSGENPSGSETEPKEGYLFSHWVADVDVTLDDGTVIKAGEALSAEQVEKVLVEQDINFTGIHVIEEPDDGGEESGGTKVPDTGEFTGANSALFIIVPVWAVLMIALGSRFAYKNATKKQVKFNKK